MSRCEFRRQFWSVALLVKKLYDVENSLRLVSSQEKFLIQNFVATLNGCTFCMDISMKKAIDKNIGLEKFYDLLHFQGSGKYSEREKVIFRYVEEMTKNLVVSDETYAGLKVFCSDEEIIEITYISASEII